MPDTAPSWVLPVMRFGYAARGVVYVIVSGLALMAAASGRRAPGTTDSVMELDATATGIAAILVIVLGLFAYAAWRLICAALDLEDYGHDAHGAIARLGQTVTGLIHAGIGVSLLLEVTGQSKGGGMNQQAESWTAALLALPLGQWIIAAAGAITLGAGGYYGYKGLSEKYKSHLHCTSFTERLDPLVKAGLVAHGLVIALLGAFLIFAAATAEPGQAGGLSQAFETVRAMAFGPILLAGLALGLLAFALYCFVEAGYRVVPRVDGPDVKTLAHRLDPRR